MKDANEGDSPVSEATGDAAAAATTVGNYFVANYPPFSFWSENQVPTLLQRLQNKPVDAPLGIYMHIPFCRVRCDFCYFKVYTDVDSQNIRRYLDTVLQELSLYSKVPAVQGRRPRFVYFGGGTPSYLSAAQLEYLFQGMQEHFPWDEVQEVTFECEPGTISATKLDALRKCGVSRLSLGIENFDADILELNNRAHRDKEIYRAYELAKAVDFPQINIDLIAGMVGETDENWARCVEETVRLEPDSVTIYQMEIPYNTTVYQRMKDGGKTIAPVADWDTKRRWTAEAFATLEGKGYTISSAYTAKRNATCQFLYRDALWTGADLLGVGVSSFSHVQGAHYQNEHQLPAYLEEVGGGKLPIHRAMFPTDEERLIREFVLQLKLGRVQTSYFQDKFGVDVTKKFSEALQRHEADGWLEQSNGEIRLHRHGLLQVDRLLHDFFLPEHRGARYA